MTFQYQCLLRVTIACDLQGADVNKADARGVTALGLAVGYNKVALVKVLLEGGADVAKTDAKGSSALHYAAGMGTYAKEPPCVMT